MNIAVKEVRTKTNYSGLTMFSAMAMVCTLLTLPLFIAQPFFKNLATPSMASVLHNAALDLRGGKWWPSFLLTSGAFAYYLEYMLNFVFVGYVSAVAFSVCDVARRLAVIIVGAVVFSKPLSLFNCFGIALALSGVMWYSYIENVKTQQQSLSTKPVQESQSK